MEGRRSPGLRPHCFVSARSVKLGAQCRSAEGLGISVLLCEGSDALGRGGQDGQPTSPGAPPLQGGLVLPHLWAGLTGGRRGPPGGGVNFLQVWTAHLCGQGPPPGALGDPELVGRALRLPGVSVQGGRHVETGAVPQPVTCARLGADSLSRTPAPVPDSRAGPASSLGTACGASHGPRHELCAPVTSRLPAPRLCGCCPSLRAPFPRLRQVSVRSHFVRALF